MEVTRHFTATVLIVYKDKVLLHKHKKRHNLLPVGGHLDRDELPQNAALREAKEETGLDITLYNRNKTKFKDATALIQPMHMLLIDMNPYHQHIDFVFYAKSSTNKLEPALGESVELAWYGQAELEEIEMPSNVRVLALEALALLAS